MDGKKKQNKKLTYLSNFFSHLLLVDGCILLKNEKIFERVHRQNKQPNKRIKQIETRKIKKNTIRLFCRFKAMKENDNTRMLI